MTMHCLVEKDGREIGRGIATISDIPGRRDLPEVDSIKCFYFPTIKLAPPIVWEIISGTAMIRFFDFSVLTDATSGEAHGPLRYIHGRSKVMKGTPRISTVLLVDVGPLSPPIDRWLNLVPAIWVDFARVCNPAKEEA